MYNKIVARAIRGAITAENTVESIKDATVEVLSKMVFENDINLTDICYINFSATKDLDVEYPAKFARSECGFSEIPMMCFQEMQVENSLKNCIRVLMVVNSDKLQNEFKHQYLGEACVLRPDFVKLTNRK